MRVTGNQPRTLAATDSATDAEKLAAYDSFVANSGTYEVADSTLTIHPIVARSPNYMSGGSDKYHFRVSGDTLWLSNTGADIRTRIEDSSWVRRVRRARARSRLCGRNREGLQH